MTKFRLGQTVAVAVSNSLTFNLPVGTRGVVSVIHYTDESGSCYGLYLEPEDRPYPDCETEIWAFFDKELMEVDDED